MKRCYQERGILILVLTVMVTLVSQNLNWFLYKVRGVYKINFVDPLELFKKSIFLCYIKLYCDIHCTIKKRLLGKKGKILKSMILLIYF